MSKLYRSASADQAPLLTSQQDPGDENLNILVVSSPPALRRFGSFGNGFLQREKEAVIIPDDSNAVFSVPHVAGNLANCILGSGLLGLPLAVAHMGIGVASISFVLIVSLAAASMNILVMSGRAVGQFRFSLLARDRLGPFGFFLVSFFVFISCLGCMLPYLIIVGDTLPLALKSFTDIPFFLDRRVIIVVVSCVFVLPFLFFKNLGNLFIVSAICLICIPFVLIIMVIRGFYGPSYSHQYASPVTFSGNDIIAGFCIMTYAMVCNQVAFMSFLSLKVRSTNNWLSATFLGHTGAGLFSFAFGLIGYLTFGPNVGGNVLNNYPDGDIYITIVRILMTINVLCSFPMQFYSARDTLHKMLGFETVERNPRLIEDIVISATLFLLVVSISVCVDDLGLVFALVGSFSSTCLTFVLPSLLYMLTFFPVRFRVLRQRGLSGLCSLCYCSPLSFEYEDLEEEQEQNSPLLGFYESYRQRSFKIPGDTNNLSADIPMHISIDIGVIALFLFGIFIMFTGTAATLRKVFNH